MEYFFPADTGVAIVALIPCCVNCFSECDLFHSVFSVLCSHFSLNSIRQKKREKKKRRLPSCSYYLQYVCATRQCQTTFNFWTGEQVWNYFRVRDFIFFSLHLIFYDFNEMSNIKFECYSSPHCRNRIFIVPDEWQRFIISLLCNTYSVLWAVLVVKFPCPHSFFSR